MKLEQNSHFLKNSSSLFLGVLISQIIAFISLPFITNYFSPQSIGLNATLLSIGTIISIFFNLQYHQAILIPSKKEEYTSLLYICMFFSGIFFLLTFFIVLIFKDFINSGLNLHYDSNLIFIIPFLALISSLQPALVNWASKEKKFSFIAKNNIFINTATNSTAIWFGYMSLGLFGLLLSRLIGYFFGIINLCFKLFKDTNTNIDFRLCKNLFNEYIKFPKITLFHSLFNSLGNELPIILITAYFNPTITGLFFLSTKISKIPLTMITSSLYNVYFEEFSRSNDKLRYFKKRFYQLFITFTPLFLIFLFIFPYIINYLFDERYKDLIAISYYLFPIYYIKLGSIFTMSGFYYFKKNAQHFKLELILFILNLTSLFASIFLNDFFIYLKLNLVSTIIIVLIRFRLLIKILKAN